MNKDLKPAIEGLLYLSGSNGVTLGELVSVFNIDQEEIILLLDSLKNKYEQNNHGLTIIETAQTYKISSIPEYSQYYEKYAEIEFNDKLSNSALETLAIIAYNQPITRFEIEEKRGVMSGHHIKNMITRDLIKVTGRSKEIGKPNLYGTTPEFLDFLGINSLVDLPPLSEFDLKSDDGQLDLFTDVEDFKEIKKRLLSSENIVEVKEAPEVESIDEIEVPELVLSQNEEEES